MCIMSECKCMPAGDKYHGKKTCEVRECQGLGGEGSHFCFYMGWSKRASPKDIRELAMWISERGYFKERE